MRTRLLGFSAAVIVALLSLMGPVAQAAPTPGPNADTKTCESGGGSVQYDSATGLWTCFGGKHDKEPIYPAS